MLSQCNKVAVRRKLETNKYFPNITLNSKNFYMITKLPGLPNIVDDSQTTFRGLLNALSSPRYECILYFEIIPNPVLKPFPCSIPL